MLPETHTVRRNLRRYMAAASSTVRHACILKIGVFGRGQAVDNNVAINSASLALLVNTGHGHCCTGPCITFLFGHDLPPLCTLQHGLAFQTPYLLLCVCQTEHQVSQIWYKQLHQLLQGFTALDIAFNEVHNDVAAWLKKESGLTLGATFSCDSLCNTFQAQST